MRDQEDQSQTAAAEPCRPVAPVSAPRHRRRPRVVAFLRRPTLSWGFVRWSALFALAVLALAALLAPGLDNRHAAANPPPPDPDPPYWTPGAAPPYDEYLVDLCLGETAINDKTVYFAFAPGQWGTLADYGFFGIRTMDWDTWHYGVWNGTTYDYWAESIQLDPHSSIVVYAGFYGPVTPLPGIYTPTFTFHDYHEGAEAARSDPSVTRSATVKLLQATVSPRSIYIGANEEKAFSLAVTPDVPGTVTWATSGHLGFRVDGEWASDPGGSPVTIGGYFPSGWAGEDSVTGTYHAGPDDLNRTVAVTAHTTVTVVGVVEIGDRLLFNIGDR